jgi:hypothetical protein
MKDQTMTAAKHKDEAPKGTALYEVIAHREGLPKHAYGVTFTDEGTATAYAERLKAMGYAAEVSPEFTTQPTLKAALEEASDYFNDKALKNQAIKTDEEGIPNNALEAFTLAMELAVSAPTDQLAAKALREAQRLSQFLEPEQVHYVKHLLAKKAKT